MKEHNILLESFLPHGNVSVNIDAGELSMTTNTAIRTEFVYDDTPIKSYIYLTDKYKLPFRVDMTLKIDSPAFYLIVGKGHIGFATGMDNRKVTDILGGDFKPNIHSFNNDLLMNDYTDISVTYGTKAMWIIYDNELRCISRKDPYIKALKNGTVPSEYEDGFNLALACDKRTQMSLKSFTVTEYEDGETTEPEGPIGKIPNPPCLSVSEKPTLEECIQGLGLELQKQIVLTNDYLLKDLKNVLNLKRKIEGGYPYSKITYVSPQGLSYKIHITGDTLWHQLCWIRYNTKREQEKYGHQKTDFTNETLNKLAEESPEFAKEIFSRIRECFGCHSECQYRVVYEHNGKKKVSCTDIFAGIHFKMFPSDFEDLRKVIGAVNAVVKSIAL
jgi:hypothetical protein